ncbi:MAG: methyltransferase [Cyanobacteria bacterium SID2]|nr:methyltransferase [Cyanobacteria bacterium SID2]MBP0003303.1 methyltransferase [Cyanobacteria bacterium SBC]
MTKKNIYPVDNINLASQAGISAKTPFSETMCESIDIHQYKVLLDIGCGSGIIGIYSLLNQIPFVYFNDIQPNCIQLTKYNLQQQGIPKKKYEFIEGSFESIDLSQYSIDLITFNPPQLSTDWVSMNIFKEDSEKIFRDGGKTGKKVINNFFQWLSRQPIHEVTVQLGISSLLKIDSFLETTEKQFNLSGIKKYRKKVPLRKILYPVAKKMSETEQNEREITINNNVFYKNIYVLQFRSKS